MLRPTDDGDIIGDVVADRSVLRRLAHGLVDMGFEELPAGHGGKIGVRFQEPTSGTFIDILAPEASLRLRRVVPTQSDRRALEAPGTDVRDRDSNRGLRHLRRGRTAAHHPCAVSARCHLHEGDGVARDRERTHRTAQKHLQDAAALLTVARLAELRDVTRPVRKRLVWLYGELLNTNSVGWQYVSAQPRADAIARLSTTLHVSQ